MGGLGLRRGTARQATACTVRSSRARVLAGRHLPRGCVLPEVPAPGRVARDGGSRTSRGLFVRGLLGPSRARFRRPSRPPCRSRACSGRTRRQPHREDIHGRPLRRLALGSAVASGACDPARERVGFRRAASGGYLGDRRGEVRARPATGLRRRNVTTACPTSNRSSRYCPCARCLPWAGSRTKHVAACWA